MVVTILDVILVEKHEIYIYQLQIMQKPEIVHVWATIFFLNMVLAAIFCFANLKVNIVKDTKYRMSSDRFEFITPKLCKNKWGKN